jgi:hypothetical protein
MQSTAHPLLTKYHPAQAPPVPRSRPANSRELPFFWRLLLATMISFAGITLSVVAVARQSSGPPPDILAGYVRVYPRQSRSEVAAHGFTCQERGEICRLDLDSGILSYVQVALCGETICSIYYFPRKDAMNVGELARSWGKPQISMFGQMADLSWPNLGIYAFAADSVSERFSYFLPVRFVLRETLPAHP